MTNFDDEYRLKLNRVINRFRQLYGERGGHHDYDRLAAFLGDPWKNQRERGYRVDYDKQEIRDKLDLLDGPHGKAIFKIMEAKNDDS